MAFGGPVVDATANEAVGELLAAAGHAARDPPGAAHPRRHVDQARDVLQQLAGDAGLTRQPLSLRRGIRAGSVEQPRRVRCAEHTHERLAVRGEVVVQPVDVGVVERGVLAVADGAQHRRTRHERRHQVRLEVDDAVGAVGSLNQVGDGLRVVVAHLPGGQARLQEAGRQVAQRGLRALRILRLGATHQLRDERVATVMLPAHVERPGHHVLAEPERRQQSRHGAAVTRRFERREVVGVGEPRLEREAVEQSHETRRPIDLPRCAAVVVELDRAGDRAGHDDAARGRHRRMPGGRARERAAPQHCRRVEQSERVPQREQPEGGAARGDVEATGGKQRHADSDGGREMERSAPRIEQ